MARLFISQGRLDAWSIEERVNVDGDVMTLKGDGRSFRIEPAVRFLRVAGDDADPHALVGKVKSVAALTEKGGEHYMNSVIFGETGYDVEQGFIGVPLPPDPGA